MKKITHHIEVFANVAIIVVAVLLCFTLGKRLFTKESKPSEDIVEGKQISVPDIDWSKSNQTLLLVLQKDCRFCTESAPFYQALVSEASNKAVRLIAVLPQGESASREYLHTLQVPISDIKQLSLDAINVRGTPTLILVNNAGTIVKSWVGKLPDSKQKEVLSML